MPPRTALRYRPMLDALASIVARALALPSNPQVP